MKFVYGKTKVYPMIKNLWFWKGCDKDFEISTNLIFDEIIDFFKSY